MARGRRDWHPALRGSIQAMRSTASGDCAAFNVNFGVAPGSLPAEMQTKRAA